tara:strand:+ start:340 stop:576 length:237 start_codon:yes stop_codon:yes gene_type:complete
VFQSIKEDAYKTCNQLSEGSSCKGEIVRLISKNTGLIFKGSGFYLNDYSRKKNKSKSKKDNINPDKKRGAVEKSTSSK